MAAFTHPGSSHFSDGTFGIYYAGHTLKIAIAETKFHRERFLNASQEAPCQIQMREYISTLEKLIIYPAIIVILSGFDDLITQKITFFVQ